MVLPASLAPAFPPRNCPFLVQSIFLASHKLPPHFRMSAIAVRPSDSGPETIRREDTFFRCDGARLKLRVLGSERCELIRYSYR